MKKILSGLAVSTILLSGSVAMANEVQISFDSLLSNGRQYDMAGNAVPFSYAGAGQNLGINTYNAPDGIKDSNDVGRISTIFDNTTLATLFDRATAANELTFVIHGVDDVLFRPTSSANTADLLSQGIIVDVYSDTSKNYTLADGTGAGDGTLVLSLAGHAQTDSVTGGTFDLLESYNFVNNTYGGTALLDVIGGSWASAWNTNMRSLGSDVEMAFSLNPVLGTRGEFTLSGTAEGVGNPVPEPATMFLFGTGLIGLAGLRRRNKK